MRTHYWLRAGAGMLALMLAVGLAGPGLTYAQEGEQPYVGIQIENTAAGARVLDVLDESPAAAAGLQVEDLITALDGEVVTLEMTLAALVLAHAPGDVVTFTVERDGESSEVEVTLGTAPQVVDVLPPAADDEGAVPPLWGEGSHFGQSQTIIIEPRGYLGVSFLTLTPEVIETLDEAPPVEEGALIMDVQEDTPAAEAGLEAGDVVTAVNGEPVDTERTLSDRIYAYEADDVITLTVVRGDEELTLEATLAHLPAGMGVGPGITIQGMP
ncbi:MAG: PDZ domain-containing protein, partial [Anaerolineae bacterium]|nr:PDZ domain-containing protein [Anaerolineae bacterium]